MRNTNLKKQSICWMIIILQWTIVCASPQQLLYQGEIDISGNALTGNVQMKFVLHNDVQKLWTNDGTGDLVTEPTSSVEVSVVDGLYSVALGDSSLTNMQSLNSNVLGQSTLTLRVWVDVGSGYQLMTPDKNYYSVAFAQSVVGGHIESSSANLNSLKIGVLNFPTTSGNNGQVLGLDSSGDLGWLDMNTSVVSVAGNSYAFKTYLSADNQILSGWTPADVVDFDTTEFDTTSGALINGGNTFRPSIEGFYLLTARAEVDEIDLDEYAVVRIYKNGSFHAEGSVAAPDQESAAEDRHTGTVLTSIVYANGTTDYFDVRVYHTHNDPKVLDGDEEETWFSGVLLAGSTINSTSVDGLSSQSGDITATGNLAVTGSTNLGGLLFPTGVGSANQVLTTDGTGVLTWMNVSSSSSNVSSSVSVFARGNGDEVITSQVTNVPFTEVSDPTNSWDGSVFTAPESGVYLINGSVRVNGNTDAEIYLWINNTQEKMIGKFSNYYGQIFSAGLSLNQGDTFSIRLHSGVTLQNSIYLHHISIQKVGALISTLEGLSSTTDEVTVSSNLVVTGSTNLGGLIFPTMAGSANQVLTNDGNGQLVWSDVSSVSSTSSSNLLSTGWEDITAEANSNYLPSNVGTANGTYSFYRYRRVGDTLEINFRYNSSLAGSGTSFVVFPFPGYSPVDTTVKNAGLAVNFNISHTDPATNNYVFSAIALSSTPSLGFKVMEAGGGDGIRGDDILGSSQIHASLSYQVDGWSAQFSDVSSLSSGNLSSSTGNITALGNLLVTGSSNFGGLVFPTTTGSVNQVLTTDGAGLLSWSNPASSSNIDGLTSLSGNLVSSGNFHVDGRSTFAGNLVLSDALFIGSTATDTSRELNIEDTSGQASLRIAGTASGVSASLLLGETDDPEWWQLFKRDSGGSNPSVFRLSYNNGLGSTGHWFEMQTNGYLSLGNATTATSRLHLGQESDIKAEGLQIENSNSNSWYLWNNSLNQLKLTNESTDLLTFDVGGNLTIDGSANLGGLLFPTVAGSANQVLVNDGSGNLNWADQASGDSVKVAFVKDIKTSGIAGGTSSADTVHIRDLNTLEGDYQGWLSLASNQFTLVPGEYYIEASAPAFKVNRHQIFLHDGSSYVADGTSEYSTSATSVQTRSVIKEYLSLSSTKTFELRHWTATAEVTSGLGIESSQLANPQSNELYSIVKIIKLDSSISSDDNPIVSGNLIVSGSSNLNGLLFPSTDGSVNQVLTTDGTGNLSFQNAAESFPSALGQNTDFESGASGWVSGTDISVSLESGSNTLRGSQSLTISKSALNASGNSVSYPFSIARADLAKMLTITFDVDASDANYADGDLSLQVYADPSGANTLISVNGDEIKGGVYQHVAQFQSDASYTSYELIIKVNSSNSAAYNVFVDNITISQKTTNTGTFIGDWVTFSANINSLTLGSGNTLNAQYRRNGDELEIIVGGTLGTGASVSSEFWVDMPTGFSIDYSKLISSRSGSEWALVGYAYAYDQDANASYSSAVTTVSNYDQFVPVLPSGGNVRWDVDEPFVWTNLDEFQIKVKVPIVGWGTSVSVSESISSKHIATSYTSNSTQIIPDSAYVPVDFGNKRFSTQNNWQSGVGYNSGTGTWTTNPGFVVQETGYYSVKSGLHFSASFSATDVQMFVTVFDESLVEQSSYTLDREQFTNNFGLNGGADVYAEKDWIIMIRVRHNSGGSENLDNTGNSFVSVHKISSPQTLLDTETVAARYRTDASNTIPTSSTTFIYEDLIKDTHNAYNVSTGEYTVPVSGWYAVNAKYTTNTASWAATNSAHIFIDVDGITEDDDAVRIQANFSSSLAVKANTALYLNKGQVLSIKVSSSVSTTAHSSPQLNTFSIYRIK